MIDKIKAGLAAVKNTIDNIVGGVSDFIVDGATSAWTAVSGAANAVGQWIGERLGIVKNEEQLVKDIVKDNTQIEDDKVQEKVKDADDEVTLRLGDFASDLADKVEGTNDELADYLRWMANSASKDLTVSYTKVTDTVEDKTAKTGGLLDSIGGGISDIISGVTGGITDTLSGIGSTIGNAFSAAIEWIWKQLEAGYNYIRDLLFSAGEALITLPEKLSGIGDMLDGFFNITPEKFVESAMESIQAHKMLADELAKMGES